jgi:hypothetical protein
MPQGFVYILMNEAMPGLSKVGKTTTTVEQRMRELDTSGVPLPFECFYAALVADIDFVERRLHDAFDDHRVRQRREFFRIAPERIKSALELAAIKDATPREDVVEDIEDEAALNKARAWRSPFNFRMVDIPPGSTLTFVKDPTITCIVSDHRYIEFEGEKTSLSGSALKIVRRMGYDWKQIAGPTYWEYEGETLDERRRRMEEE